MTESERSSYVTEIESWRAKREQDLRAPDSWLSLAGLFHLYNGHFTIGSDVSNEILLPASAPAQLGTLDFQAGEATLTITCAEPVLVDGKAVRQANLVDNGNHKSPTLVTTGSVTFFVHSFGEQFGIRIKDSANHAIAAFGGCRWYEVKPEYRLLGRYVAHDAPNAIPIQTTVQVADVYNSVGTVEFELAGQALRLLVQDYGVPNQRAIVMRDATSGKSTYPPARFLNIQLNPDGTAWVDFNKAYSPPCAFTPYATCPLPPRENILPVAIEAGEQYPPHGATHTADH